MATRQATLSPVATESSPRGCPRCGEAWDDAPALESFLFEGVLLRRCLLCGERCGETESGVFEAHTCQDCGLPFFRREPQPMVSASCPDCMHSDGGSADADAAVAAAAENEIRDALAAKLRCVSGPQLSPYLDGIARSVATVIPGAPTDCRVVLIDDGSLETLALPSGLLLVSLGILTALEDEAELAFVLGHELAHVASGDASRRLVRFALRSVTRDEGSPEGEVWLDAALDLVRIGYGTERECKADIVAVEAMGRVGYDPRAALRFLDHVRSRTVRGDVEVREYALAHPNASARGERIQRGSVAVARSLTDRRVNREVFRRAAGSAALTRGLAPIAAGAAFGGEAGHGIGAGVSARKIVLGVLAITATALALAAGLGFF